MATDIEGISVTSAKTIVIVMPSSPKNPNTELMARLTKKKNPIFHSARAISKIKIIFKTFDVPFHNLFSLLSLLGGIKRGKAFHTEDIIFRAINKVNLSY